MERIPIKHNCDPFSKSEAVCIARRSKHGSECVMAAGKIHVLEDRTPLRCDDSRLIVDSCEFVFKSEVSPSLFTTRSTSGKSICGTVKWGPFSGDVRVVCEQLVCAGLEDRKVPISEHLALPDVLPLGSCHAVLQRERCGQCVRSQRERVFGRRGARRERQNDAAVAEQFIHAQPSTFTDFLDFKYIQHATIEVTTNHRYIRCLFQQCTTSNVYGGAIRCDSGASLEIVSCRFDQNTAIASSGDLAYIGGGIYFKETDSLLNFTWHIRSTRKTTPTLEDPPRFWSRAIADVGKEMCCLFFNNEALDVQPTTVDGQPVTASVGNDIRFDTNKEWKAILANDSSFINSFSDSRFPRISIGYGPHIVDFSYLAPSSYTVLDVRLPDPAVLVDISKGSNGPVCGRRIRVGVRRLGMPARNGWRRTMCRLLWRLGDTTRRRRSRLARRL
ncbi:hypothetical protein BLNAU_23243 [Blattamonas nauphoetae]|uniref:Uncharacterized protein n=1 Tax=Blattamonas nauphoetae TaxID=2049346 RepID=A0ABQ9WQR3_9EUKA|nr:hypothetical protein BLNAU_23243 [Blattamonas nauphoetae]